MHKELSAEQRQRIHTEVDNFLNSDTPAEDFIVELGNALGVEWERIVLDD